MLIYSYVCRFMAANQKFFMLAKIVNLFICYTCLNLLVRNQCMLLCQR